MLSGENRPSVVSPTAPAPSEAAVPPKALPNPPPVVAVVVEKLNPEADPNPEDAVGGGLSALGAANEKDEADGTEEEPNPDGGCVGAVIRLPNPVESEDVEEEPNPELRAGKPKVTDWAGAPKPAWSE